MQMDKKTMRWADTEQCVEHDERAAGHEVNEDDTEAVVGDVVEDDIVADERSLDAHTSFHQPAVVRQRRQRYRPTHQPPPNPTLCHIPPTL